MNTSTNQTDSEEKRVVYFVTDSEGSEVGEQFLSRQEFLEAAMNPETTKVWDGYPYASWIESAPAEEVAEYMELCWCHLPLEGRSAVEGRAGQYGNVISTTTMRALAHRNAWQPFPGIDYNRVGLVRLSDFPTILAMPDLLTPEQCDGLVETAKPLLQDWDNGSMYPRAAREEVRLPKHKILEFLFEPLFRYIDWPYTHFELPDVIKYRPGEFIRMHMDNPGPEHPTYRKGNCRVMSIFLFLNTPREGGEVRFQSGLTVESCKGTALVHFPTIKSPTGKPLDDQTYHWTQPATSERWVMTCFAWLHPIGSEGENVPTAQVERTHGIDAGHLEPKPQGSRSRSPSPQNSQRLVRAGKQWVPAAPSYWKNVISDQPFNEMVMVGTEVLEAIQVMISSVVSGAPATRDRKGAVLDNLSIVKVERNENKELWIRYAQERGQVMWRDGEQPVDMAVKTAQFASNVGGELHTKSQEVYLWHGTKPAAAGSICSTGFDLNRVGSSAGLAFGSGVYLAENAMKSDEHTDHNEPQKDLRCIILCRVVLGQALQVKAKPKNPDMLTAVMKQGDFGQYHSVCADREALVGTYREFIVFENDRVYPEFVVTYKRQRVA